MRIVGASFGEAIRIEPEGSGDFWTATWADDGTCRAPRSKPGAPNRREENWIAPAGAGRAQVQRRVSIAAVATPVVQVTFVQGTVSRGFRAARPVTGPPLRRSPRWEPGSSCFTPRSARSTRRAVAHLGWAHVHIGEVGLRVAVLGAGNGGVASAFDFAQHGHEVSLYATPEFGENVVAVNKAGGIAASGDLHGFASIRYAGHDAAEAMAGAELVVLVGPAYSTEPLAAAAGPHLTDGMAVLICPGSCAGAIAFKRAAGVELDDERCIVGETSTLPYA